MADFQVALHNGNHPALPHTQLALSKATVIVTGTVPNWILIRESSSRLFS